MAHSLVRMIQNTYGWKQCLPVSVAPIMEPEMAKVKPDPHSGCAIC